MADEMDSDAFEATLRFIEECAVDSFTSLGLPELTPSIGATFASSSGQLPDAIPSGFLASPFHAQPPVTETLPSPMAVTTSTDSQRVQPGTIKRKTLRPRKVQANPNRVRNELRFELAYLREKAAQLEQELTSMQQRPRTIGACAAVHRQETPTPTVVIVPQGGSLQEREAWKGIASRQRKRREDAERENTRLKLIVERQRKTATDLANLVRKRLTQAAECSHAKKPSAGDYQLCRVFDFQGDIGAFRDLFGHLEAAYAEIDTVLEANGLATMETPTNDVHIREGVDGKYLEFFANRVLPFGVRDTAEAAWDHFKGVEKHCGNGGIYEKMAKSLDQPYTIIEDFTKELHSNNSRADIKVKQIIRRYVEAERDIIVFVASIAPTEIQHKAIPGLIYHLRGYVVTKKSPLSAPGHELSILQFCSRVSIDRVPGMEYDPDHTRAVIRFLIGNTAGNIRCYQERIENALVDRALSRQ